MFAVDMSNTLGMGAFGCVYKAQFVKKDGYEQIVAVKMVNPEEVDVTCFKALLTEVKIMSYVGGHENVVQFIGAVTKEIKESKLIYE